VSTGRMVPSGKKRTPYKTKLNVKFLKNILKKNPTTFAIAIEKKKVEG